jgi:hypothetical protein
MGALTPQRRQRLARALLLAAALLAILGAGLLSYGRILGYPLLVFDASRDAQILLRALARSAASPWQPVRLVTNIWIEGTLPLWRPVNSLVFEGFYRGFGDSARAWHALSLLLHSLNAVALFFLLRLLFRSWAAAFVAAWLFAFRLPLDLFPFYLNGKQSFHREMLLGWIPGLAHLNMSFCYLLSLALALAYSERGRRWAWPAALAAFALALGCKEDAVTLPLMLTGILLLRGQARRRTLFLASFWLLALSFALSWRLLLGGGAISQNLTFRPLGRVGWWWFHLLASPLELRLSQSFDQWAAVWVALSLVWLFLLRSGRLRGRLALRRAALLSLGLLFAAGALIFGRDGLMLLFVYPWPTTLVALAFLWPLILLWGRRSRELALGAWWVTAVFVPQGLITAGRQSPQDYYLPEIWPAMAAGLILAEAIALVKSRMAVARRSPAPGPPAGDRPPGTSAACGR